MRVYGNVSFIRKYKIFFSIIFIFSSFTVFAQSVENRSDKHNLWISLNAGAPIHFFIPVIYADFTLEYSDNKSIYSVQYFGVSELRYFHTTLYDLSASYNYEGISLLYGRIHKTSLTKISYSGGLSFLMVPENSGAKDKYDRRIYLPGIPLSIQFVFTPIRLFAVGVKLFANLNRENSIIGASVGLFLGRVK